MEQTVPQLQKLDETIEGLTAVRQFLVDHPDLPPVATIYDSGVSVWLHASDFESDAELRDEFARCARILMAGAPIGSITKDASEFAQTITRVFGAAKLRLCATREAVCERRVIGTEKVRVPDPEAEVPTIEVEREIVEWECRPILADSDEPEAVQV